MSFITERCHYFLFRNETEKNEERSQCEIARLFSLAMNAADTALSAFFAGFLASEWVKKKVRFVCAGDLVANERIGIANLIIFVDKRSNMERTPFLSVSYQNKKTKDFFVHASPYSYCIAPVPPVFAVCIRPNRLTPGLTM